MLENEKKDAVDTGGTDEQDVRSAARRKTCLGVISEYRKYRYEKFKEKYEHNGGQKKD